MKMLFTINDMKQMIINDFLFFSSPLIFSHSPHRLFFYGFLLLINAPTFTFPSRMAGQV